MSGAQLILQEIRRRPAVNGVTLLDILELSEPLRLTLKEMVRHGPLPLNQIAARLGVSEKVAGQCVKLLIDKGYLEETHTGERGENLYRVALAPLRGKPIPGDL